MTNTRMVGLRLRRALLGACVLALLTACAGGPEKPKPTELAPNAALIGVRLAWSAKLGVVDFPLDTSVSVSTVEANDDSRTPTKGRA